MKPERCVAGESRALTDAALVAERAGFDAIHRLSADERRLLDDLIERDRLLADARLLKFREREDQLLAIDRLASPPAGDSLANERLANDVSKLAERATVDAILQGERSRVDAHAETGRSAQDVERAGFVSRRQATDERLSDERGEADATAATLGQTEDALASSRADVVHRAHILATVAHDLRSPLSVISSNAALIIERTRDAFTREAAEDVARASARMGRLLTDLLDVVRIESGTFRITKARHDVGALLSEVLHSYGPLFAARGVTFTVDLPKAAVFASFDYDRIVQLLSNLLSNAMKFTPPEGTVDLHVGRGAKDVEFVLRDSGPGIHPDVLPHLFERFSQVDSDTRRGLGLGLYISKSIVEAHGGCISVESEPRGATFSFSLPAG